MFSHHRFLSLLDGTIGMMIKCHQIDFDFVILEVSAYANSRLDRLGSFSTKGAR
jgi:hypothetical protein